MSYGPVDNLSDNASYSAGGSLTDGESNTTSVSATVEFQGYPVSSLTESQKDAIFQDFLDYLAAYPGLADPLSGAKTFPSAQTVTPTEED